MIIKKVFLLYMFTSLILVASELPDQWDRILDTNEDCNITASLLTLESSPFAFLKIEGEDKLVPMLRSYKEITEDAATDYVLLYTIYSSITDKIGLEALPSYEISIPPVTFSSLPSLTISYSGFQEICSLSYAPLSVYDLQNVGSIGHGQQ